MAFRFCIAFYLLITIGSLHSQSDTSIYVLNQVDVTAISIKENAIGAKSYKWSADGNSLSSVSDLLTKEGCAYIKQYGPGTLATSAIRGGNAYHTLVMWNGLPIQSPTLGLLDMSLLATDINDEVTLQEGGNSSMWGSGAVAGVIGLNTLLPQRNKIDVTSAIGSFGTYKNKAGVQLAKGRWTYDARWQSIIAQNDFPISIPSLGIDKKQSNASQSTTHVLQNISFAPKANQLITLHYWYLDAARQLPPTLAQTSSTADQVDQSHRLGLHYKVNGQSWVFNARIAYFVEKNDYRADTFSRYAMNRFTIKMADVTLDKIFGRHKVLLGSSSTYTEATTDGFTIPKMQQRYALYAGYTCTMKSLTVQSGLRWEVADDIYSPLVPSLGATYDLHKHIKLRARINHNYRFPTLNDLYWNPGGNKSLKPESGWSEEIGMDGSHTFDHTALKYDITIYTRTINNWIQWGRLPNDFYFSAINLAKVWSRGLSSNVSLAKNIKNIQLKGNVHYELTYSTHLKSATSPTIRKGDQLWYVPQHTYGIGMSFAYARASVTIDHHFFGETNGINEDIAAYNFGNLSADYWSMIGKSKLVLFASVNNYQNKNYFSVERLPSAGRYMQIGAKYIFNL